VSAVATILGLLLVVTFIANFLTTSLPNQMQVNDLNHELQVENQFGRLQAALEAASNAQAIGALVSQPISLGSAGDPPFANPDGATLHGVPGYQFTPANTSYSFSVLGGAGYDPPGGFGAHNPALPSGCTATSITLSCGYLSSAFRYNFSLPAGTAFTPTLDDGSSLFALNVSTNSSAITFNNIQGLHLYVIVIGNHNTITIDSNGAVRPSLIVLGSNNTIALNSQGGGNVYIVHVYGNDNTVTGPGTAGDSTVYLTVYGIGTVWDVTDGGSDANYAWFNGFNPSDVTSTSCPYDGLANTNTFSGFTGANAASMAVTYNNSTTNNHPYTHTGSGLTVTYQSVASSTCPYVSQTELSIAHAITPGAVVYASLSNAYIPSADVAFDEGAVVFAQYGGYPILYEAPAIEYTGTTLSVWFPQFTGSIGASYGLGTVDLTFRLLSVQTFALPATGLSLPTSGSYFDLTIQTPYAEAWMTWLDASATLAPLDPTCTPAGSAVCTGAYQGAGTLGTVTLAIPTSGLAALSVTVPNYSIALTA